MVQPSQVECFGHSAVNEQSFLSDNMGSPNTETAVMLCEIKREPVFNSDDLDWQQHYELCRQSVCAGLDLVSKVH